MAGSSPEQTDSRRTAAATPAPPSRPFLSWHSDALFRMPTLHLAEAHTAAGGTAFLYELRWPSPAQGGTLGACHALDVPLFFGTFSSLAPECCWVRRNRWAGSGPTRARTLRQLRDNLDQPQLRPGA